MIFAVTKGEKGRGCRQGIQKERGACGTFITIITKADTIPKDAAVRGNFADEHHNAQRMRQRMDGGKSGFGLERSGTGCAGEK